MISYLYTIIHECGVVITLYCSNCESVYWVTHSKISLLSLAMTPCNNSSCEEGCAVINMNDTCFCPPFYQVNSSNVFACIGEQ